MKANKRQLAEIFGIAEETITQWAKSGCPVEVQRRGSAGNVYDTGQVFAWRVGRCDAVSGALDPAQERARLHEAQRLKLEREALVASGKLVPADDVVLEWADMIGAAKSRLLALPSALAGRIAPGHAAEVLTVARQVVYEALEELSRDGLPAAPPPRGSGSK